MEMSFEPLTPVSFLERSAHVFGDRLAVASGERRFTYREHWERTLRQAGLDSGDRSVSVRAIASLS